MSLNSTLMLMKDIFVFLPFPEHQYSLVPVANAANQPINHVNHIKKGKLKTL